MSVHAQDLEWVLEVSPPDASRYYYFNGDYETIVARLGDVLVTDDYGSYQGDTVVVYDRGEGKYAVLVYGWGSCAVCDALESCESSQDVAELIAKLREDVIEFEDRDALDKWIAGRYESGSHYSWGINWPEFALKVAKAIEARS